MRRIFPLIFIVLFAACEKLPPQQEHFAHALKSYNDGDFESAILYLKPLVEAGNPAAQLLMAKMYSRGDGVPEDTGKAELLRNLAAFQIYKKKDLPPGVVRPDNETLKGISDRLDYYVEAGNNKAPPQDLSAVLESLDVKGTADLQNAVSVDESGKAPEEVSAPPSEPVREPGPPEIPHRHGVLSGDSRRSDQISLSEIHKAAESGDPMAMELLSAAYANGFYGLKPNPAQARTWAQKAVAARLQRGSSTDNEPQETTPLAQVWTVVGIGMALVAAGLWRWSHTHHRRKRAKVAGRSSGPTI